MDDFATAWAALDPAPRRALALAFDGLVAGSTRWSRGSDVQLRL